MAHRPAKLPRYQPQLALLVKAPPEGDEWLHELKLDGFRIGVAIAGGDVKLLSRREKEWTEAFPTVVAGAKKLPVDSALIDGELAFRQHAGGHTTGPNWPIFLKFADRYIKGPPPQAKPPADSKAQ